MFTDFDEALTWTMGKRSEKPLFVGVNKYGVFFVLPEELFQVLKVQLLVIIPASI